MPHYTHWIGLAAMVALTGCSALSPWSTQTRLALKLTGNDLLNPDINDRPSPVVVRLMELKKPGCLRNPGFLQPLFTERRVVATGSCDERGTGTETRRHR